MNFLNNLALKMFGSLFPNSAEYYAAKKNLEKLDHEQALLDQQEVQGCTTSALQTSPELLFDDAQKGVITSPPEGDDCFTSEELEKRVRKIYEEYDLEY